MEDIELNDYADNLLIVDKNTIDKLYSLDNAFDCIALYMFYYKTAKWQKTNIIKANDSYITKSLKIGKTKLNKTKQTLKDNGLIEIVQRRNGNRISGWYIKVHYLISDNKKNNIAIEKVNNPQNEQVEKSTSSFQNTNALRDNINCLKNKIELLKEENNKLKSLLKEEKNKNDFNNNLFDKFWNAYPRHVSKGTAEKWFGKNKPSEELVNIMIDKISLLKNSEQWKSENGKYIPYPTTWLNAKGWEDEVISTNNEEKSTLKEISEGLFQL